MDNPDTERIIRLLEEIRDNQRLQLQHQEQALERQAEVLARQRERLSGRADEAQAIEERANRVLAKSAQLVGSARLLLLIAAPTALLVVAFLFWVLFTHGAP